MTRAMRPPLPKYLKTYLAVAFVLGMAAGSFAMHFLDMRAMGLPL